MTQLYSSYGRRDFDRHLYVILDPYTTDGSNDIGPYHPGSHQMAVEIGQRLAREAVSDDELEGSPQDVIDLTGEMEDAELDEIAMGG